MRRPVCSTIQVRLSSFFGVRWSTYTCHSTITHTPALANTTMVHISLNRQLNSLLRRWQIGVLNNGSAQRHECHFSLQSIRALGWMRKGWFMGYGGVLSLPIIESELRQNVSCTPGIWMSSDNGLQGCNASERKKWAKEHESHIHQPGLEAKPFLKEKLKVPTKRPAKLRRNSN